MAQKMRPSMAFDAVGGVLAAFFALVQLRLVLMLFGDGYSASVAATLGVMEGGRIGGFIKAACWGPLWSTG